MFMSFMVIFIRFVQSKYITPSSGNIQFALMALVGAQKD